MEILTLNDGTAVNGHILDNGDGRIIYVYLDGKTLAEGFVLFSDPEETKRIVAMNRGIETVYLGYTNMTAISSEYGNCNIVMQKG